MAHARGGGGGGDDDPKESLELLDVEVWSDAGWARASRLIRHRLAPHKRLYRVATGHGIVDVTDDHSLIAATGEVIKTRDARVGDRLMHAPRGTREPPQQQQQSSTFQYTRCRPAPSNVAAMAATRSMAMSFGRCATDDDCGVPPEVLCSEDAGVRVAYLRGLLDSECGDGGSIVFRNHRFAADVFSLTESIGWRPWIVEARGGASPVCIGIPAAEAAHDDDDDDDAVDEDMHRITSIEEISGVTLFGGEGEVMPPYVYDFTTASGRFAAGVGRIVVHNTDSIFIVFKNEEAGGRKLSGRDALASSIRQGQAASKGIKPQLAPPHNLEYEKTMFPLVLLSKKRYVGLLYEDDPDAKPKQKSMGIALKRRDYAPIVKQVRNFSRSRGDLGQKAAARPSVSGPSRTQKFDQNRGCAP